jgi:chromosome segregation ATPase
MAELVKNIYILMALALLIGLFLGWILRRSATRRKYAQHIDDLSMENERTISQLHEHSQEYENNTRGVSLMQDSIKHKQEQINDYGKQHQTLLSDMDKFKQNQITLENELEQMDDKIQNSTDQLEILNAQKDEILKTKDVISNYEEKIISKEEEIKEITKEITTLSSLRESTNAKLQNINESIDIKQKEIDLEDQKIDLIKGEFKTKTSKLKDELEHSRVKLLNYQYALKYVNEKLESKEALSFDTIDKIISKNEETGLFKNLFKKLFSKSANYITGGN